jgi:hypothetical protein
MNWNMNIILCRNIGGMYLWHIEFEQKDAPRTRSPSCEIADKMLENIKMKRFRYLNETTKRIFETQEV